MVEAQNMKYAVYDKGKYPLIKGYPRLFRLFFCPFERDYNITDDCTREIGPIRRLGEIGEGNDVCRPVFPEEFLIQVRNLFIVYKENA
jgi:hypothetical protein